MVTRPPAVLLLVVLLLALAAPASPTLAGAATGPALSVVQGADPDPKTQRDLDKIDSQIAKSFSDWYTFQAMNAIGYQVLWTHKSAPKDGADALPDGLDDAPTNMSGKSGRAFWDAGKMPSSFSARVRVDVYDGPRGRGYVLVVQTVEGTQTWQRAINYGPEGERDQPWSIIPVAPP